MKINKIGRKWLALIKINIKIEEISEILLRFFVVADLLRFCFAWFWFLLIILVAWNKL